MNLFKDRIEEIVKQIEDLHRQKKAFEDLLWVNETLPELVAMIGSCFKCRNSYSCPKTEEDYWWIYYKVIGIDPSDRQLITEMFQECVPYGSHCVKIEFETRTEYPHHFIGSPSYISISPEEYEKERKKAIVNLKKPKMVILPQ